MWRHLFCLHLYTVIINTIKTYTLITKTTIHVSPYHSSKIRQKHMYKLGTLIDVYQFIKTNSKKCCSISAAINARDVVNTKTSAWECTLISIHTCIKNFLQYMEINSIKILSNWKYFYRKIKKKHKHKPLHTLHAFIHCAKYISNFFSTINRLAHRHTIYLRLRSLLNFIIIWITMQAETVTLICFRTVYIKYS